MRILTLPGMAKPPFIELGQGRAVERIPILYEDRSALAVDKPRGWMLVPFHWQRTQRNLQAAIQSSIAAGDFWAKSRNIRFLRYVHRLDAETSGVLLLAKSPGAVESLAALFKSRRMEKRYLAVVCGSPKVQEWTCHLRLAKDADQIGKMKVDKGAGKQAETRFRVLKSKGDHALVEARPITGRTHQIRIHLAADGLPILGDELYGGKTGSNLALRAVELAYQDPFTRRPIRIKADSKQFLEEFGFREHGAKASSHVRTR